nr:MAG TPA: hypothetical protein [Caudoviricetes sp.]DAT24808.1 MAG TPA: hypothetical protein [Caudoviricetes sp.]
MLDGGLDFNTVFYQMSPNQVSEANYALDYYIHLMNKK